MMDAPSLFPNGFHPCSATKDRGGFHRIKSIPRYKASGPVNYYFIDFGISRHYEDGQQHLVIGDDGADREVPEMTDIDFYGPFPADVFIIGNIFRKHFLPVRLLVFQLLLLTYHPTFMLVEVQKPIVHRPACGRHDC